MFSVENKYVHVLYIKYSYKIFYKFYLVLEYNFIFSSLILSIYRKFTLLCVSSLRCTDRIIFVSWDFSQLPQPHVPSLVSSHGCFSEFEQISRGQEKRAKVCIFDQTLKFYVFIQLAVQ